MKFEDRKDLREKAERVDGRENTLLRLPFISTVLIQTYSSIFAPIASILENVHKRGVKVEVVLDKNLWKEKYSKAHFLASSGIPMKNDTAHAIAHNKIYYGS